MKKKWMIIILIVIAIVGFAAYRYLYREHRDIASENAEFTLKVSELQESFSENDSLANEKYADKTIRVSGKVTAVDTSVRTITIDGRLSASLTDESALPKNSQQVTVKGRLVGYDDLLEEIKMDQVTIIN